jgi:NAD(P)-dependent dehydrogenase (short-subunit alcohol dehydrogenase family)
VAKLFTDAVANYGKVDILVNNAGAARAVLLRARTSTPVASQRSLPSLTAPLFALLLLRAQASRATRC